MNAMVSKVCRFIYLRNNYNYKEKSAPLGCVAISLTDKKSRVIYQVSVCNPADDFNRSQARQLALGRLIEAPKVALIDAMHPTMHDITRAVMFAIETEKSLPTRAQRAASAWLSSNGATYYDLSDRDDESDDLPADPFSR